MIKADLIKVLEKFPDNTPIMVRTKDSANETTFYDCEFVPYFDPATGKMDNSSIDLGITI